MSSCSILDYLNDAVKGGPLRRRRNRGDNNINMLRDTIEVEDTLLYGLLERVNKLEKEVKRLKDTGEIIKRKPSNWTNCVQYYMKQWYAEHTSAYERHIKSNNAMIHATRQCMQCGGWLISSEEWDRRLEEQKKKYKK